MRAPLHATIVTFLLGLSALAASAPVRNFPLVNQEGKAFQLYDLKGNYVFVSFVFTRCPLPKMCPLTMTLNQRLDKAWKKTGSKPPLRFLVVTLDPDFDKPAVLKKFAAAHSLDRKTFTLATGNPQVLSDFAAEFNVMGIPSGGSISHNMKNILLAPDMTPIKEYKDNEWQPEEVLKDLSRATVRKTT